MAYFSFDRDLYLVASVQTLRPFLYKDSRKVSLVCQMTDQRPPVVRDSFLFPVPHHILLLQRYFETESKLTGPASLLRLHFRMHHFPSQEVSCLLNSVSMSWESAICHILYWALLKLALTPRGVSMESEDGLTLTLPHSWKNISKSLQYRPFHPFAQSPAHSGWEFVMTLLGGLFSPLGSPEYFSPGQIRLEEQKINTSKPIEWLYTCVYNFRQYIILKQTFQYFNSICWSEIG